MNTLQAFVIIATAGLIHASFQLSVSVLTLLSGHAIGKGASHGRVIRLVGGFVGGVAVMTTLLTSTIALVILTIYQNGYIPAGAWAVASGLLAGLGIAVWGLYYRHESGTTLWLPRGIARYLSERAKATKHAAEAFGLGLSSVAAELLFIVAPTIVVALTLIELSPGLQLLGIATYTLMSLSSLLLVSALIGGGHKISKIQKWREANKSFLQFVAGSGLLILASYLYVYQVVSVVGSLEGVY